MTTTANPLLADGELPPFSAITPDQVLPAIDSVLADYQAAVDDLTADARARDFAALVAPLESLEEKLGRVFAPVSHLHGVKDSPALREAYSAALEKITEHSSALGQNHALFEAVQAVRNAPAFANLERAQQTLVEDSLRGFRLAGVALEEPARTRFRDIQNELSKVATGFEEAVLDATDAWTRSVSEAELAGLSDSVRSMLAHAAKDKRVDGWLATLKGPVVQAILTFADDRALREEIYTAYNTRASDQGPGDHAYDNSARIGQILALRHESAQLLGFASSAHLSLVDKMAGTPERVLKFLHDLAAKARPVAARELAGLRAFAASELAIADLQPWDVAYASEKLRERRFDFSEEDIKPYFPLPQVMTGLFELTEKIFGVRMVERAGVDVWHPDVQFFDLVDADGSVRAGVYLDHYARSGKRGGAWMDICRTPLGEGTDARKPVAFLTCNFSPPMEGQVPRAQDAQERPPTSDGKPSLLTHNEVLTLFHEFGHGLHHLLTDVRWPSVGGINGVEWDAVELPSQFMENYGWQREALNAFARHWQSGEILPEALYQKMLAARHFHAGLFLVRQLEFALFDFRLHLEFDAARGPRTLEILAQVRDEVAVIVPPAWHRSPQAFTHIFSGGYAAGYYSYLWAEVLSADAFAAFEEAGVFDAETGARYRREILAVGGSRPALESFVAFRGREPEPEALLRSHGLAA
ncbi:MAG TPA: M3 family metallopeptidase [Arenimonas sp.]|uniref:M3 family metallopeptidase n=1 Tax=Arenimonas sp. TaxID=1872635 RepID=UPI002C04EBA8|nr:M3 family metallopeptidase [Arenimonas sp.]HMB56276.1 M3 family metallopeptidase [Arenimonas sp.]